MGQHLFTTVGQDRAFMQVIDGKAVDSVSGERIDVACPSDGKVFATIPASGKADVDKAVRAARRAFEEGAWPKMPAVERGRLLVRLSQLVGDNADELAALESRDTGKPARRRTKAFGLIDAYEAVTRGPENRLEELRITLSEFTFDATLALEVLSIDPDYFKLRKGTEKRLYELARKHCGDQGRWKIGLDLLQKKVGSRQPLFKFRAAVRAISEANTLPGYHIVFLHTDDSVVFYGRNDAGLNAMQMDAVTRTPAMRSRRKTIRGSDNAS